MRQTDPDYYTPSMRFLCLSSGRGRYSYLVDTVIISIVMPGLIVVSSIKRAVKLKLMYFIVNYVEFIMTWTS